MLPIWATNPLDSAPRSPRSRHLCSQARNPIAALTVAALAVKEGVDAWRGDNCCEVSGLDSTEDVNPYEAPAGENQGVPWAFSWLVWGWLIHATGGIVGG